MNVYEEVIICLMVFIHGFITVKKDTLKWRLLTKWCWARFPAVLSYCGCENSEQVVVVGSDDLLMCRELTGCPIWLRYGETESHTHTHTGLKSHESTSVYFRLRLVIDYLVYKMPQNAKHVYSRILHPVFVWPTAQNLKILH